MPALPRAIPTPTEPTGDDSRHLPKTLYVDFAQLEQQMSADQVRQANHDSRPTSRSVGRRVTTVDEQAQGVRLNVRDAAKSVLTWLASVSQHNGQTDLDRVLNRCLRPGADTTAVNYTALAEEVNQALGTDLSPKRVQTAVRHLRKAAGKHAEDTPATGAEPNSIATRFTALHGRLASNHDALIREGRSSHVLRRAVAHDVLAALRSSAGRLIECGFGEGIPDHVDLDATRQRFLAFVRRSIQARTHHSIKQDIDQLLKALRNHDGTAEADMQLVTAGVCVVTDLTGPDSIAGVMARLNLIMVGRPMLDSDVFIHEMLSLADQAGALIHERQSQTDMAWVRLQPKDRQTPSPNRVRSYCLNNAATHILQRLHTGELQGGAYFQTAQRCHETMAQHDRGFGLLKVTEAIMLCVLADMTGNTAPAEALFTQLGKAKSLSLLADLARYDNSPALNRLVRHHAQAVHEGIADQLLVLPG